MLESGANRIPAQPDELSCTSHFLPACVYRFALSSKIAGTVAFRYALCVFPGNFGSFYLRLFIYLPSLSGPSITPDIYPESRMKPETDDLRISSTKELISPDQLISEFPVSTKAAKTVETTRQEIQKILQGMDDRLVVVVGPCSIHDPAAAVEYGELLNKLREQHEKDLKIVMRVYFCLLYTSDAADE